MDNGLQRNSLSDEHIEALHLVSRVLVEIRIIARRELGFRKFLAEASSATKYWTFRRRKGIPNILCEHLNRLEPELLKALETIIMLADSMHNTPDMIADARDADDENYEFRRKFVSDEVLAAISVLEETRRRTD